jgi:hypothetical protein
LRFTPADRTKLNSIEFGATAGGGGGGSLEIEQDNITVSINESVLNFTNAVVVTDQGAQTDIEIAPVIDGGVF